MKAKFRNLLVSLTALGLIACGGEEPAEDENQRDEDLIECGPNTVEVDGVCVADVECEEDETATSDGRCVFTGYCGDDTYFDPNTGLCRANANLRCGEHTSEEDGECVPDFITECGEGTVIANEVCRPSEDVCGEDTSVDNQQQCRPVEGVCGEGTAFDFTQRVCVPLSFITCGPGTTNIEDVCIPSRIYYENLAEEADLDRTAGDQGEIVLKDIGERFVFVGNIDAPTIEDDQLIQHEDHYTFQAQAGQWLQIGLYSLGLPEPGFLLFDETQEGDEKFTRLSDLGAGIETHRYVVIPENGEYDLIVSNLPQLLGNLNPAGGEDWKYVGYIDVVEAPDARDIDINDELFSGNVIDLKENLYFIDGIEEDASFALVFDTLPLTSEAEVQVWTDLTTLEATYSLSGDNILFDVPGESFYLLFDRAHSFGGSNNYSVFAQSGSPLNEGQSLTMEIELEAGEYVGLFQFNTAGASLRASINDAGMALVESDELSISTSSTGETSLYWYAHQATTVTLEVENTTDEDIGLVSLSHQVGEADRIDDIDGDQISYSYDQALPRGRTHFIELDIAYDELLAIRTFNTFGDTELTLYDADYEPVQTAASSIIGIFEPGQYLLGVKAISRLSNGFNLRLVESPPFEFSETSQPGLPIPYSDPSGVSDTITVSSCPGIVDISVDVHITYPYPSSLHVRLRVPDGTSIDFHDQGLGVGANIIDSFPYPSNNALLSASELLDLIGTDGSGNWVFTVSNNSIFEDDGSLDSWTLNLTCQGQ